MKNIAAKHRHLDSGIRRHRTLARSLHGRLYVSDDRRLWLVRGRPDPQQLFQFLTTSESEPKLEQLGFACIADGEATGSLLATAQQSLQFWEAAVRQAEATRPRDRRNLLRWEQELAEIRRLRARVIFAYRLVRELRGGKAPESAFVLLPEDQQMLAEQLTAANLQFPLPKYEAGLVRLVMWLTGEHAVKRFVTAVSGLIEAPQVMAKTAALERLREYLVSLKERSVTEQTGWLHWELAQRIETLPPGLISKPGKRIKRSGKFVELCDRLLKHCDQLLAGDLNRPKNYAPAAIAALAAGDSASGPLPARFFSVSEQQDLNSIHRRANWLLNLSREPGYERLLVLLATGNHDVFDQNLSIVQELLARGISANDLRWLGQLESRLQGFCDTKTLSVAWVRRAHTLFATRKMSADTAILQLMQQADKTEHRAAVQYWLDWLAKFTTATATPRLGALLYSAIKELFIPALELGLQDDLQAWSQAATTHGCNWLQRIEQMQRWAGQEVAVPKSVQKILDYISQARQELTHLENLAEQKTATSSQLARKDYLLRELPRAGINQRRVDRQAEEAFVVIALDGLRKLLRRRAQAIWDQHSAWQTTDVPLTRLVAFARWLQTMPAESRKLHSELMTAWSVHGDAYKLHLSGNQGWIERARERGIHWEQWIDGGKTLTHIDERPVELCFCADPREVFLMGTYFQTCLSLGQMNQMSVLANAYDANKQVVFAYGEHEGKRVALGRMLVAVSSNFQMLRFDVYSTVRGGNTAFDGKVQAEIVLYAARRAQAAGLTLSDCGDPEALGSHFWYNDGEKDWSEEAKQAWQDAASPQPPIAELLTRESNRQLIVILESALIAN